MEHTSNMTLDREESSLPPPARPSLPLSGHRKWCRLHRAACLLYQSEPLAIVHARLEVSCFHIRCTVTLCVDHLVVVICSSYIYMENVHRTLAEKPNLTNLYKTNNTHTCTCMYVVESHPRQLFFLTTLGELCCVALPFFLSISWMIESCTKVGHWMPILETCRWSHVQCPDESWLKCI